MFLKAEVTFAILGVDFLRSNLCSGGDPWHHHYGDHQGGSHGGHQERGLHLHQAALCHHPKMGRQWQGGCKLHLFNVSPSTAAAPVREVELCGGTGLHWGALSAVPGCPQPYGRPEADHQGCGPTPLDPWPAHRLKISAVGCREAGCHQKGIPCLGEGRNSASVKQPLGLTPAHGQEAGWQLETLR
jgi:hypothetical protein